MCRKGEQSGCPGKGYAGQGLACDTLGVVWCVLTVYILCRGAVWAGPSAIRGLPPVKEAAALLLSSV